MLPRTSTLVTLALVVALATVTVLRFKDQAVPLVPEKSLQGQRMHESVFSCDLLPEVHFSYPEFSGWHIIPGESSALDQEVSCGLGVTSEDVPSERKAGGVVIKKQLYTASAAPPEDVSYTVRGVAYVYVSDSLAKTDGAPGNYGYITFYTDRAEYRVQLVGLSQVGFPVDEFLKGVLATFDLN